MAGVGGSDGGGLCKRSITDFATSAAERMVCCALGARDLRAARALGRKVDLDAAAGLDVGLARAAALGLDRTAALGLDLDLDLVLGFGFGFGLDFVLGLGLGRAAALGAALGAVLGEPMSLTLRRASFAAFFAALNDFRACLRRAFADRTPCLAVAASAAAVAAAALRRCTVLLLMLMVFRVKRETKIDGYRRLPGRRPRAPWGIHATRLHSPFRAERHAIVHPTSWARRRPVARGP